VTLLKRGAIRSAELVLGLVVAAALVFATDWAVGRLVPLLAIPKRGLVLLPHSVRQFDYPIFSYTERVNSLGLRDHEVTLGPSPHYRILVIGDSFVYGSGVELEDTWVKVVERRLRDRGFDVEVVNGGRPGSGPAEQRRLAECAIPRLCPNLVVIAHLQGDDAIQAMGVFIPWYTTLLPELAGVAALWHEYRMNAEFRIPDTPTVESAEQHRRTLVEAAAAMYRDSPPLAKRRFESLPVEVLGAYFRGELNPWSVSIAMSSPRYFWPAAFDSPDGIDSVQCREAIDGMASHFKRIDRLARREGGHAVALVTPHGPYVNAEARRNLGRMGYDVPDAAFHNTLPERVVMRACDRAGVPCYVDGVQGFRDRQDEPGLYFSTDVHFTVAGNRLFADLVTPILAEIIAQDVPEP